MQQLIWRRAPAVQLHASRGWAFACVIAAPEGARPWDAEVGYFGVQVEDIERGPPWSSGRGGAQKRLPLNPPPPHPPLPLRMLRKPVYTRFDFD